VLEATLEIVPQIAIIYFSKSILGLLDKKPKVNSIINLLKQELNVLGCGFNSAINQVKSLGEF